MGHRNQATTQSRRCGMYCHTAKDIKFISRWNTAEANISFQQRNFERFLRVGSFEVKSWNRSSLFPAYTVCSLGSQVTTNRISKILRRKIYAS